MGSLFELVKAPIYDRSSMIIAVLACISVMEQKDKFISGNDVLQVFLSMMMMMLIMMMVMMRMMMMISNFNWFLTFHRQASYSGFLSTF